MENLVRSSNLSTKKSNIKMFKSLKRIFGWNVFNRCEWPQQLWNFQNDMLTPKLFSSSNLSTKPLQDSWFSDDKCKSLDKNLFKGSSVGSSGYIHNYISFCLGCDGWHGGLQYSGWLRSSVVGSVPPNDRMLPLLCRPVRTFIPKRDYCASGTSAHFYISIQRVFGSPLKYLFSWISGCTCIFIKC